MTKKKVEKKEITKAIKPVHYKMNQATYDSIVNLLDTVLKGAGMAGLESVNGVLDGIKRVPDE